MTSTFSGSFNKSNTMARQLVTSGSGELTASLSAKPEVKFELRDASGALLAGGAGGGKFAKLVTGGTYTLVVSGTRGSYTLTATYPGV